MRRCRFPRRVPLPVLLLLAVLVGVPLVAPPAAAAHRTQPGAPPPGVVPAIAGAAGEDSTFDTVARLDELTSDHARIFRLYWAFFGRRPDAAGALYWIGQRDRCRSLATIADQFAASEEFADRYGQLDDHGFVELAYHQVLDRPADPDGGAYWHRQLVDDVLTRGGVMLHISLSSEFAARHRYPSDEVPARGCRTPDGRPTGRSVDLVEGKTLATVAGLDIVAPSVIIERAGFHQSSHPGALGMTMADPAPARLDVLASRNRGTHRRGAVDIVTEPATAITAPVSGRVARAGGYTLYCKYRDGYVVINPDGRPDLEVKILHIQNVAVRAGQRVEVGDKLADHATLFPFESQIDRLTGEPSWPHVHLEVVDPSIPRRPSSGGGC